MTRNSFLDSIRVDQATIDNCNNISKQASQNSDSGNKGGFDGGCERGDSSSAPLSQGRESGFKWGDASDTQNNSSDAQGTNSQSSDASVTLSMGEGTEGNSTGGAKGGTSVGGESGVNGGCEGGNGYGCGM